MILRHLQVVIFPAEVGVFTAISVIMTKCAFPLAPQLQLLTSSYHGTYIPSTSQSTPTRSSQRESSPSLPVYPCARPRTHPYYRGGRRLNSRRSLNDRAAINIAGTDVFGTEVRRQEPSSTQARRPVSIALRANTGTQSSGSGEQQSLVGTLHSTCD